MQLPTVMALYRTKGPTTMRRNRFGCLTATVLTVVAAYAIAPTSAQAGISAAAVDSCGVHVQTGQQALASAAGSTELFQRAKAQHVQWLTSMSCVNTGRTHTLQASTSSTARPVNTVYSSNWSGYQINKAALYAQTGWNVPTVVAPNPGYSTRGYWSTTWSGIGGGFNGGSGALIQSGTAQDVSQSGVASYYAWYEIVNPGGVGDTGGEVKVTNLPIHPGDNAGSVTIFNPSTGQATIGVCNFSYGTGGTCINFTRTSGAPSPTAEWIVEAPYNGGVLPLANFGSVLFYHGCWTLVVPKQGDPCSTIQQGNPTEIDLQAYEFGKVQTLASPGPIAADGSTFTDYYHQPH
jgi:hypothetical protein